MIYHSKSGLEKKIKGLQNIANLFCVIEIMRKPNGHWTKERLQKEALKFETRGQFKRLSSSAHTIACKKGWLNCICSHMDELPVGYWNDKERCRKEALKYDLKEGFKKGSISAYNSTYRNGWVEELCSHMKVLFEQWTFDKCEKEAGKFTSRSDFSKNSRGAYQYANKKGWLDEICSHMTFKTSMKNRYVYSYEFFNTNSVYVGLSWSIKMRHSKHMKDPNSTVNKYLVENNLTKKDFVVKELGYYDMNVAGQKETEFEQWYKDDGWIILNRAKTGGLGSDSLRWTKKKCKQKALKFKTRKEFQVACKGAYASAQRNGWLDDIYSHMKVIRKRWDFDSCEKESLKYPTRSKFKKGTPGAYDKSKTNGWLDKFFPKTK